ncbi:MAG: hypothetical protein AB1791_10510 [Chloroflexota bacterium]
MTKVAILPMTSESNGVSYHAVANGKQSYGKTAGEALDALTAQLSVDESSTLVIVQSLRPDRFFNATQQQRLANLMSRWRAARDLGEVLPAEDQAELETLIEAELRASAERAAALLEVRASCSHPTIPHNHVDARFIL